MDTAGFCYFQNKSVYSIAVWALQAYPWKSFEFFCKLISNIFIFAKGRMFIIHTTQLRRQTVGQTDMFIQIETAQKFIHFMRLLKFVAVPYKRIEKTLNFDAL